MTGSPILSRFQAFGSQFQAVFRLQDIGWPDLHTLWLHPERLPRYAAETPVVGRTLALLGPLDWGHFPERNLARHWCQPAVSYAAFAGAVLVKLNEGLESMGDLRQYLVEHPGLIPLLGFRVARSRAHPCDFDPQASLPTSRHLTRMLRQMPNAALQFLLALGAPDPGRASPAQSRSGRVYLARHQTHSGMGPRKQFQSLRRRPL